MAQNSKPTEVWALTTDGTSLFAGGNFTLDQRPPDQPLGQARPDHRRGRLDLQPAAPSRTSSTPSTTGGEASVYAGGDFSIAASQGRRAPASTTRHGAVTGWNPNADARIESLEVSPSGQGSTSAAASTPSTATPTTSSRQAAASNARGRSRSSTATTARVSTVRVFSHRRRPEQRSRPTSPSVRPSRAAPTAGNKFVAYNPTTGVATWHENGPDGDAQAIELINGRAVRRLPRRLERRPGEAPRGPEPGQRGHDRLRAEHRRRARRVGAWPRPVAACSRSATSAPWGRPTSSTASRSSTDAQYGSGTRRPTTDPTTTRSREAAHTMRSPVRALIPSGWWPRRSSPRPAPRRRTSRSTPAPRRRHPPVRPRATTTTTTTVVTGPPTSTPRTRSTAGARTASRTRSTSRATRSTSAATSPTP